MESQNQPIQGTTFVTTCFNGLNVFVGVGLLSVPYAVSEGGWTSLIALFLIAFVCYYTSLLLKQCMDADPRIKTYPDIGQRAFGRHGRAIISMFVYLELFLLAVEFLVMEADNLNKLFPNVHIHIIGKTIRGKKAFVMITAVAVLPITWLRDLSLLAYTSASGIFASIILVADVFWIGAFEDVGFKEKGVTGKYKGLPIALSMYTFCYCAHAVLPTLYSSMRHKNQFPKVLLVCFSLSTIAYGSMAVIGYRMFGGNLMSQVTLNLPIKNISSKVAIYLTLVNPFTKYPLVISPIATALEEKLVISPVNAGNKRWMLLDNNKLMNVIIRTSLVVITVIVALVVPFFGYIMGFIGAFLSVSASILFPCLCYLKIKRTSREFGVESMFIVIIVFLGLFIGGIGTYISVRDIVKNII